MVFIGIDLGTSFIKGAVLDLENLSLQHIRRVPFPEPVAGLPSLFYEVDPLDVVAAFKRLVAELLPHAPGCAGLVMCSQMHGLVLTTAQGEPRSNCLTWQDQRALLPHPSGAGSYFQVISNRLNPAEHRQQGNELKPSLPLCYLFWLAENKQLSQTELIPAALPDFVLAYLSGTTPGIERTNAAAHGALNLESLDWHEGMIAKLGLEHLHWPVVRPFGQVVAEIEIEGQSLPCYTPVGDHQCAVAGAFLDYSELSLNIATASQVTMLTPELTPGNYQSRPFFDGRFMNTIARIPAGRSLNVLVNLLSELAQAQQLELADPWPYIAESTAAVAETSLQVDLAFFASSVGERGMIANIQEDNLTIGHLFRAAFQNMANNYDVCASRLSPERAWERLVFSGGLVQKIDPLRQIICDKFQLGYRLSASQEDTLLGLLALALVAGGRAGSVVGATMVLQRGYKESGTETRF
jgi:sugar (pentulose or hexulose) kinase